jgi:hypothetical protein
MPAVTTLGAAQAVMQRLALKLGGVQQASVRLGIRASLLERFIDGSMPVPDALLLRAADLHKIADQPPPALLPQSPAPKGPPVI